MCPDCEPQDFRVDEIQRSAHRYRNARIATAPYFLKRAGLTAREVEVLALVSRDASTRQIAERLVRVGSASACGRVSDFRRRRAIRSRDVDSADEDLLGYERASACHRAVIRGVSAAWSITSVSMRQLSSLV
jgi:hypothetical protein